MKALLPGLLCLCLFGCGDARRPTDGVDTRNGNRTESSTTASSAHAPGTGTTADRTNTAINARDRDSAAKTPIDQNENQSDINITAGIRQKVIAERMSVEASNVKIITQDGKVTLRGPVQTDDEKAKIEEIARGVAGADKVTSELEVAGK